MSNESASFMPAMRATVVAATLYTMSAAALAVPAISFDEATGSSGFNQEQSVGWQFNVNSAIRVTGLGWFDQGANGLGREHTVGIWDGVGNLLTSILVPVGTAAPLDGQYRIVPIVPIILSVDTGYIVGGQNFLNSGDRLAANVTQLVHASIGYVDATFSSLGGFQRPTFFSSATTGFYGPMFALDSDLQPPSPSGVPEPSTLVLLGLGLLGVVGFRRRRSPK